MTRQQFREAVKENRDSTRGCVGGYRGGCWEAVSEDIGEAVGTGLI